MNLLTKSTFVSLKFKWIQNDKKLSNNLATSKVSVIVQMFSDFPILIKLLIKSKDIFLSYSLVIIVPLCFNERSVNNVGIPTFLNVSKSKK